MPRLNANLWTPFSLFGDDDSNTDITWSNR